MSFVRRHLLSLRRCPGTPSRLLSLTAWALRATPLALALLIPTWPVAGQAAPGLTWGVLIDTHDTGAQARYAPLAQHLSSVLNQPVRLKVMDQADMDLALRQDKLDLLLTSPSHYAALPPQVTPAGVLATLVHSEQGRAAPGHGGVIFTRQSRQDIRQLTDLQGKSIAASGQWPLCGLHAQTLALKQAGVPLGSAQVQTLDNPSRVLAAVLDGKAEVGFACTGALENLADKGLLTWANVKIVNPQQAPELGVHLSTTLYPGWPMLALRSADPELMSRIASTLQALPPGHPALQDTGWHGFTVAADYLPVVQLAQALRLPPHDQRQELTLPDVLHRHPVHTVVMSVLLLALAGAVLWLARQRQQLQQALRERGRQENDMKLAASVFANAQEGILITDPHGTIVDINGSFTRITGYGRDEVLGHNPSMLGSGRQGPAFYEQMWGELAATGQWHGEIWNRRKSGEVYAELLTITAVHDGAGQVRNYLAVFSDITAQKEYQKQLEFITHFDVLTRLPNRSLLSDRLQQAMAQAQRRNGMVGVVLLDLDGFKSINDLHGHDSGDQLLQTLGKRLKDVLREGDTLSRVGGDEFAVVLTEITGAGDCERVLGRLLSATAQPIQVHGQELRVSASLGVALFPRDGADADLLLRHADQAMYQAKQAGKNRYHFFDAGEDEAARQRRQHVDEVAQALAQGEFELYYQPKVNMRSGQLVGAEALIRWNHPDGTVHGPGSFLPGIEGHPLSARVGQWVMETGMAQLATWQAQGVHLPLSVNVSPYHLQQKDFVDHLRLLLKAHPQVSPRDLQLEVLETSALEDMDWVAEVIGACNELGVAFALDDFGTGYSSLTYLKRLPAQVLKIDQSFVRDMLVDTEDLTIVEGIVGLAHAFGRTVIAEGVETVEHGELLLRLGCDLAQGYGVARPMPIGALNTWMAQWQAPPSWLALRHKVPHRNDLPMALAEVEHRQWVSMVERVIDDPSAPPPVWDVAESKFTQALAGLAQGDHPATTQLKAELRQLHDQVHTSGLHLMSLAQKGQDAEACQAAREQMQRATAALIQRLRSLAD